MNTTIPAPAELSELIGRETVTDWQPLGQDRIDGFADATGDRQWVHVDPDRAKTESPFGTTIAHGYLLVSLIGPALLEGLFARTRHTAVLNYGLNRVRFLAPVPAGTRVRCLSRIEAVEPKATGLLVTTGHTLEIEGGSRPAMTAEALWLAIG